MWTRIPRERRDDGQISKADFVGILKGFCTVISREQSRDTPYTETVWRGSGL